MFESISTDTATVRQGRSRLYKALPASLLVHGLAFVAVPVYALWKITFPAQSPRMAIAYSLIEPLPPPPPAPPRSVPAAQPATPADLPPSDQMVAPNIVPDEIPIVTSPALSSLFEGASGSGVEGGETGGVWGGTPGGTAGGVPGGDIGGTEGGVAGSVDDGRVIIPRDESLQMFPLSKTYPIYPNSARLRGWEDQLVVRYVIGTDGRVKEVIVLDPAERRIFDEAAVHAIRHWRFRPMIRNGRAIEVVHELTIYFKLIL